MQTLWGEERDPQPTKRTTPTKKGLTGIPLTAQDCRIFGHSFTSLGMAQEKVCCVCGMHGYCPGCTRHTPESRVQA